ncbi:MAG: nuclear transport factor 2 family protein [Acidobacteriota bacterium]
MAKKLFLPATLLLFLPLSASAQDDLAALLQRQTQEMVDAIASGGSQVWERYLDDKVLYTSEDGTVVTKKELVEGIRPLPPGVAGTIKVIDFQVARHGDVAVASYLNDEHETYHGHELHCQYRTTDTWLKTPAGWRLIAGQVLAVRTDPPAVALTPAQMDEYVGSYQLSADVAYEIRRTAGGLEGQQTGRKAEPIKAEAPDVLFVPGKPRYRYLFQRGADGRITGLIQRREAWDLDWSRLPNR